MSDSHPLPSLAQLLSSEAELLHSAKRPYIEKRVVKYGDQGYVLYRVPEKGRMLRFERTIKEAAAAGVSLQEVLHGGCVSDASGHWLIMRFVPGSPLRQHRPSAHSFAPLGIALGRLHKQEASAAEPILCKRSEPIPYGAFLARHPLTREERQWAAQSAERMYRVNRFQLAHGDLHAKNIMVDGSHHVALIDYELFSFEPAGLELAMVLLRGYCRNPRNRQTLLNGYFSVALAEVEALWRDCAADFLFAAALRLAAQRRLRKTILQRRNFASAMRSFLERKGWDSADPALEKNRKLQEQAGLHMARYEEMAIRILRHACRHPDASDLDILSVVHGN
jgi:Ser/Thr protein kinase RdoA (MazF antagonist)